MIPLIDGDIITYRAGFSAQTTYYKAVYKDDGFTIEFEPHVPKTEVLKLLQAQGLKLEEWELVAEVLEKPVSHACQAAKLILTQILSKFNTQAYKLYLTSNDKSNYRFTVAETKKYKGNRVAPKPRHYEAIREYLINVWNAEVISGKEADDALGIEQVRNTHIPRHSGDTGYCSTSIVSIDKDLDMIPGYHYNFVQDREYFVSDPGDLEVYNPNGGSRKALRGGGLKWFYAQILLGDNADNIPGISGYGAVKVHKLLQPITQEVEMYKKVRDVYHKHIKDRQVADQRLIEVANLLWIQREDGVLWHEPNEVIYEKGS